MEGTEAPRDVESRVTGRTVSTSESSTSPLVWLPIYQSLLRKDEIKNPRYPESKRWALHPHPSGLSRLRG